MNFIIKLDYTLETPAERLQLVEQILQENPEPNEKYLETLADYLILCMEKQKKKERKLLTENRLATVNKRETSFEGLVSQLECGEDGIYNLLSENGKNQIFSPTIKITKQDLEEIPLLRQLREAIEMWERKQKTAQGKEGYIIKNALIELRKDQYVIKNAYRRPIKAIKLIHSKHIFKIEDKTCRFDEEGYPIPEGISLLDPKICSAVLCNYSKLKEDCYGVFDSDLYYFMEAFDEIVKETFKDRPLYLYLLEEKIDGRSNAEIQQKIQLKFGINYTHEYISNLWRHKIPRMIAATAEHQWLDQYYLTEEKGKYKKCGCCGQIKLAHNKYFSKNKTIKDGLYSICKECRQKKQSKKEMN